MFQVKAAEKLKADLNSRVDKSTGDEDDETEKPVGKCLRFRSTFRKHPVVFQLTGGFLEFQEIKS